MDTVSQFASVVVQAFVLSLGAIVGYQLLNGQINLEGLLGDKLSDESSDLSPGGVQLLVVMFLGVFYCLKSGLGS